MKPRVAITVLTALVILLLVPRSSAGTAWRPATSKELRAWIPARVPVVNERIETESRTASGIVDSGGRYVAGAVLITAGYSADGKYSNYLVTQVPLKIGTASLPPGEYVFGWNHVGDSLHVLWYGGRSGRLLGEVRADRDTTRRPIASFQILPPSQRSLMLIGRFAFPYQLMTR